MPRKKASALSLVSPAARASAPIQSTDAPLAVQSAIAKFEADIGGRAKLVEALASAETTPEVQSVLRVLGDPQYDPWPLTRICHEAGISPGQLFSAFKAAAVARATVLAMLVAADAIPAVAAAVMAAAVPHDQPCPTCNATGQVHGTPTKKDPQGTTTTCTACQGVGTLHVEASLDHQQLAFELSGLVKKGGGMTVAVQTHVTPTTVVSGGYLEQIQQAGSELLYGKPAARSTGSVDGETAE